MRRIKRENVTLADLRAMTPKQLSRFFDRATEDELKRFTTECPGEAHSNPFIDHCMVCLYVKWGRTLK